MKGIWLPTRHVLAVLWTGLLVVGCMAQIGLIPPKQEPTGASGITLVKPNPQGTGNWRSRPDGTTEITVRIGTSQLPAGSFATQKVDLTAIAKVAAFISIPPTGTRTESVGPSGEPSGLPSGEPSGPPTHEVPLASPTIVDPTNAVDGYVSAPAGNFSLTFPPIPKGAKRTLTIIGYDSEGTPVPGALIKTLFDNTADTGSFEISYRTTPTADLYAGLSPEAAAAISTSSLQAAVDAVTGYSGPGVYSQCHPFMVDIASMIGSVNDGSSTAGILGSPAGFRQSGSEVSTEFDLPPNPTTADLPSLYCTDPVTDAFTLTSGAAGTYTSSSNASNVTAVIDANGHVQVTFHKMPTGSWTLGAKLPGDGSNPNPNYFTVGENAAGYNEIVNPDGGPVSAFTAGPYHLVEPKYATGQIRWRKDTASGYQVQNLATSLPSVLSGMTSGDSSDFNIYVGPSTAPYTFTGDLNPSGSLTSLQILGPDNVPEATRPQLVFGTGDTFAVNSSGTVVQDVAIRGAKVTLPNGGVLRRVTVAGQRIASGSGAAVTISGGSAGTLDTVHVYDVRQTAAFPSSGDVLAGIQVANASGGTISDCLVDDAGSNSGNFALRFETNASAGKVAGIAVTNSSGVTVSKSKVIGIGRITGTSLTAGTMRAIGIDVDGTSGVTVSGCQVKNVEGHLEAIGIALSGGTVMGCIVDPIQPPAGGAAHIAGIVLGDTPTGGNSTASQNTVQNLGETGPVTTRPSLKVDGIVAAGNSTSPTITVSGNLIKSSGADLFTGITVKPGGSSTTWQIQDNTVTACLCGNTTGSFFCGIETQAPSGAFPNLFVQHNNVTGNTIQGQGFGIRTDVNTGTCQIVNNSVSGNTCNMAGTSPLSAGAWTMIAAKAGSSATVLVKDNVVTGNTLLDSSNPQNVVFRAIQLDSQINTATLRNNVVSANTLNAGGGDNGNCYLLDVSGLAEIHANRIYDTTLAAGFPAAMNVRPINASNLTGTAGLQFTLDHNIVAEPALTTNSLNPLIYLDVPSPAAAQVRHNSLLAGNAQGPAIQMGSGSSGNVDVINNAMKATSSGSTAAVVRYGGGGGATDYNWVAGWSSAISGATNTQTGSGLLATNDPTVDVGGHAMGNSPAIPGANGATNIGAQGTYAGVLPLDAAPSFSPPSTPVPPAASPPANP